MTTTNATLLETTPEVSMTVPAYETSRNMYTIDMQGNRVLMGKVTYRDYEDDRRVRNAKLLQGNKAYNLGGVSSLWNLVDPYQAIEPLLEAGFTNVDLLNHRAGGAAVKAVLSHPDFRFDEVIHWDTALFPERQDRKNLYLAAKIDMGLRPGHAIRLSFGFYRVICHNGLVSTEFGMGNRVFNHVNFLRHEELSLPSASKNALGPKWISEQAECLADQMGAGGIQAFPELAARIDTQALDWTIDTLERYLEDEFSLEELPQFARKPFQKLTSQLPPWGSAALLEVLKQARLEDAIGLLDVANMLTDVASPHTRDLTGSQFRSSDEMSWVVYDRFEPLMEHLRAAIEVGAFKKDIAWRN